MLIQLKNVTKTFGTKKNPTIALKDIDLDIEQGSFSLILGRSGSGKSTLLSLLAGLDKVTSGQIIINGQDLSQAKAGKLAQYRSSIGIIFQAYNLLPNLNVVENIQMGCWASGKTPDDNYVNELLTQFGLTHRQHANIKTLSGGEKQRVAIARSLIGRPSILFCDEPTGALDKQNETQVTEILQKLHQSGLTIIMVTHNPEFKSIATDLITIEDGILSTSKPNN
ncbi:MAG: ABC transporter ATP-binding protein [Candidatus Parcubacteria bacterium]|nr:ABC transporter ATP-binding protein [Candidatus Paceibacterota bacterium]